MFVVVLDHSLLVPDDVDDVERGIRNHHDVEDGGDEASGEQLHPLEESPVVNVVLDLFSREVVLDCPEILQNLIVHFLGCSAGVEVPGSKDFTGKAIFVFVLQESILDIFILLVVPFDHAE